VEQVNLQKGILQTTSQSNATLRLGKKGQRKVKFSPDRSPRHRRILFENSRDYLTIRH
jgi:hypothetical protein